MCGIAGLYTKTSTLQRQLGLQLSRMLAELSDRGPDSAGVAFYRQAAPAGACKVSLHSNAADADWAELGAELERSFGAPAPHHPRGSHATFVIAAEPEEAQAWLSAEHPELTLMSAGR